MEYRPLLGCNSQRIIVGQADRRIKQMGLGKRKFHYLFKCHLGHRDQMREVGGGRERRTERLKERKGNAFYLKVSAKFQKIRRKRRKNKKKSWKKVCQWLYWGGSAPHGWWTAPLMGCCSTDTHEHHPQQEVKEKRLDFQSSLKRTLLLVNIKGRCNGKMTYHFLKWIMHWLF